MSWKPYGEWVEDAACAGVDLHVFFGVDSRGANLDARKALRICESCPVLYQCQTHALEQDEPGHGIIGGMTVEQRKKTMRKTRRKGVTRGKNQGDKA